MKYEYRVIYQREGCRKRIKRCAKEATAERFMKLLGPEPWTAFDQDPDDFECCDGWECGCTGKTVREWSDFQRLEMPRLEFARIERREVAEWEFSF